MAGIQNTIVNGNRYSFVDISTVIAGITYAAGPYKSIDYSHTQESNYVYGTNTKPLGRTPGQWKGTASIEMLKSEYQNLIDSISQTNAAVSISTFEFDIQIAYTDEQGTGVILDTLISCRIQGISQSNAVGTDATYVKLDLMPMDILYDGVQSGTPVV